MQARFIGVVLGVFLLVQLGASAATALVQKDCERSSIGLTPLTELGTDTYQGESGGLYPDGSNELPAAHLALGLSLSREVVPRATDGSPDPNGLIGFISIGVSNTEAEFGAFMRLVDEEVETDPALVLVNGAQSGRALDQWSSPRSGSTWDRVDEALAEAGVGAAQVQVAWVKLPARDRGAATLESARADLVDYTAVLQRAKAEYPNLQLAYVSSRIYGGYIPDLDSEPNAYNHGFAMKWLIERQIEGAPELNANPDRGEVVSPWIDWGPYMWADGVNARADGLSWHCDDYAPDGVHPGRVGSSKVADLLLQHFMSDPTAWGWFDPTGEPPVPPVVETTTTMPPTTTTVPPTTSTAPPSPTTVEPEESSPSTSTTLVATDSPGAAGEDGQDEASSAGRNVLIGAALLVFVASATAGTVVLRASRRED